MYTSILLLPAIGSIIAGFFSKFIGNRGAMLITTGGVALSCILSILAFYEVGISGSPCYIYTIRWIDSGLLNVYWSLLFDSLTITMLVVVTLVSTIVHTYSMGYMSEDPHTSRFFCYLSFFTFCMLALVTANNIIQLFLGWEGVGVSSYLLINFWFTRIQANKSAMKAIIVNRVGDFGLAMGIIATYYVFRTTDFAVVFASTHFLADIKVLFLNYEVDALNLIGILFFIGAIGKSAQIGLHTWLPDAMEGPTPVSALIHAATMVTAGVFLILRLSPMLEYANDTLLFITFIGATTAFFAATTGLVQNDLKRIIAYSTCSQLGYMVFACGLSSYSVSLFHLMNHAFFKALLFLCAGSIIHALADEQDIRRMGGLVQLLPFSYVLMLIASLSLMGIPFLTGFYSKDVILELAFAKFHFMSNFAYWLGTISALFTSFYSLRLIYFTFFTKPNAYKSVISHAHDAPLIMAIPLFVLVFGSVYVGYLFKDMMIGMGTDFWRNALLHSPQNIIILESEFLPAYIKLIPVIFSIIGAGLALILNYYYSEKVTSFAISPIGYFLYKYLNKKYFFDMFYNRFVVRLLFYFGYHVSFKTLDRGLIEKIGPNGLVNVVSKITKQVSSLQTGFIYHYLFIFVMGLLLIILSIMFSMHLYIDLRLFLIFILTIIFVYTFKLD